MSHLRQARGSTRASRRFSLDRVPTDHRKSPERGGAEAPVYGSLSEAAQAAGFTEITPSRVHLFAKARLIPPTSTRRSLGIHGFATELRPRVVEQLLALCALRRLTRSRKALAVLLWADGWDVPIDVLKLALRSPLPSRRLRCSDRSLDEVDRLASRTLPRLKRMLRPGRIGDAALDAAAALAPVVWALLDRIDSVSAANLERLMGFHRGRTDSLPGVKPWLSGRPSFAWNAMLRYANPSMVRDYIDGADQETLDRSQAHARFLIYELPEFVRGLEAREGSGFGGMGFIARLGPQDAALLGCIAVVVDSFRAMSRRLDSLIEGLGPQAERRDVSLQLASAYTAQHPDQAGLLRRHGLDGLAERGLARPLEGVDELLARVEALLA